MKLLQWPPRFRSLQASFLATVVPLVLLVIAVFFAVQEYRSFQQALDGLRAKQQRIMASQSIILAESVWLRDRVAITLTLASAISDPDLVAAAVFDASGRELASFGRDIPAGGGDYVAVLPISYASDQRFETIGRLATMMSDERIRTALRGRLLTIAGLAVLLSLAVVVAAQLALRHTIAVPLNRLLESIRETRPGARQEVAWDRPDEIGRLIAAFNEMQRQARRHERELQGGRQLLEQRVRERTIELTLARDEAEAANRAKTAFLANISHELRTPLNAIIGFADILQHQGFGPVGDSRYRDHVADIRASGEHLLWLINDLLDLSKAESGKLSLYEGEVDLAEVVEQALKMLRPQAERADVTLIDALPQGLPRLRADVHKLKQICLNLLANAIKFTDRGGSVTVTGQLDDQSLCLAIADTGIGISKGDLEKIMQPFVQVDSDRNRRRGGTGLGLPLSRKLVELHGGRLRIESEPGVGTSAFVELPTTRILRRFGEAS